jgi:hypothetical protein
MLMGDSALNIVSARRIEFVNLPPAVTISGKARVRKTTRSNLRLRGTAADSDSTITAVNVKVGRALVTVTDSEGGTSAPAKLVVVRQ